VTEKQEYEIHPNEWAKFLTPDWQRHFERIGEELVQFDVSHHNYGNPEKHYGALYWLGERRRKRESREETTLRVVKATLVVAALTLLATLLLAD
jgi:hypothetical protein